MKSLLLLHATEIAPCFLSPKEGDLHVLFFGGAKILVASNVSFSMKTLKMRGVVENMPLQKAQPSL